jgi:hypothetical protein
MGISVENSRRKGFDVHDGNLGVSSLDTTQEGAGSNDVQSGNTEQSLGVKDTGLLEDFSEDGDGRVDGVGDDADHGLGAVLGTCLGEVSDDGGVGVLEGGLVEEREGFWGYSRTSRLGSFPAFGGHRRG